VCRVAASSPMQPAPEGRRGRDRDGALCRPARAQVHRRRHVGGRRHTAGAGRHRVAHYIGVSRVVVVVQADEVAQLVGDDAQHVHPPDHALVTGHAELGLVAWRRVHEPAAASRVVVEANTMQGRVGQPQVRAARVGDGDSGLPLDVEPGGVQADGGPAVDGRGDCGARLGVAGKREPAQSDVTGRSTVSSPQLRPLCPIVLG
jgi:hypothetical protein